MAKVTNQTLPTEGVEETLDPPIEFTKTYRRVLSEGIDHPKLPAGQEIVTFSKKESRPAQRSDNKYFNKPKSSKWRDNFLDCKNCWRSQYPFDSDVNPCHSAGSRHYLTDWDWVAGSSKTAYNKFMQECLDYAAAHPGVPFPRCIDIKIYPSEVYFCAKDEITFSIFNAYYPVTIWADAGTCGPGLKWTAPDTWAAAPSKVKVYFQDSEGRAGCYELIKKSNDECCCEEGRPVVIAYTTPAMQCGQDQTLSIDPNFPGCPPYSWFLDGGGSLNTTEGDQVVYSAPLSNPSCALNPHISVEDSCGTVCAIHLAVNCYTPAGNALSFSQSTPWWCCEFANCNICGWCHLGSTFFEYWMWNCKSIQTYYCTFGPDHYTEPNCGGCGPYTMVSCPPNAGEGSGSFPNACCGTGGCYMVHCTICGGGPGGPMCGVANDCRTQAMKDAGCCPINPMNGLPF